MRELILFLAMCVLAILGYLSSGAPPSHRLSLILELFIFTGVVLYVIRRVSRPRSWKAIALVLWVMIFALLNITITSSMVTKYDPFHGEPPLLRALAIHALLGVALLLTVLLGSTLVDFLFNRLAVMRDRLRS